MKGEKMKLLRGDMTIKEKARVAWEQDLEVVVEAGHGHTVQGRIDEFSGYEIHITSPLGHGSRVGFSHITDIRFVGEPCDEAVEFDSTPATDTERQLVANARTIECQSDAIRKLTAENAELKRSLGEPEQADPVHDIASERWHKGKDLTARHDDRPLFTVLNTSEYELAYAIENEEHADLMTAAPELADKMRKLLDVYFEEKKDPPVDWLLLIPMINLLRKLGIPDVATWYTEGKQ